MTKWLSALTVLALLAACGGASAPRYAIDTPTAAQSYRSRVETVMLRQVSLPSYAAAEEIAQQDADGAIVNTGAGLWADDPVRGVTLALARQIDRMSSATVAAEPWPLTGIADAVLEVRVERMVAGADGRFRLAGQYFASGDGAPVRPVARDFDIVVAIDGEGIGAVVAAQSAAIGALASEISQALSY
ncbi:MAG: PqiC family protein [Paracoccaceae bacterium]